MSREPWMLPREEMIGRSLDPSAGSRRTYARRRLADRRVSMLLACVAIVTVFVSGAVLMFLGGGQESGVLQPKAPDTATPLAPPQPYPVFGYIEDGLGDPAPGCTVTITNTDTGEYVVVSSDGVGFYTYDIMNGLPSGCATGDVITVVAVSDALQLSGENQGTVDLDTIPAYLWLDITLDVVIPEFSMLIVPVAGVMLIFAAMGMRRRNKQ